MKKILNTCLFLAAATGLYALAPALDDAVMNDDGSYTNWFGTFTPEGGMLEDRGWVDHAEHGRLYLSAFGNSLWIYDPNVDALGESFNGWIYTNKNWFPYFYVRPLTFLYYVSGVKGPAGTPRVFVNLGTADKVFLSKSTTDTIVDIAVATDDFSSLVAAVLQAELAGTLSSEGPFTVFAPTNEAFDNAAAAILGEGNTAADLLGALDKETLTGILTYHVVSGRVMSGTLGLDLGAILKGEYISGYVETVNGADLKVDVTPFGIMLNTTTMVTWADIEASNGVIHVIDSVLLPPKDIVGVAVDAGFSYLAAAATKANLVDTLMSPGPFTVFAPTNDAFDAAAAAVLGEGNTGPDLVAALSPEALADILLYHVVGAQVYSSEVSPGEVTMANTDMATLSVTEAGTLKINDANIIATDVAASNGVIHVIDAVILPPAGE
ncbi:MAG: fasciclin domain-containing protein [Puniceicoccaceae bacterium]